MLTNDQKLKLFKCVLEHLETDEMRDYLKDMIVLIPDDTLITPSSTSLKYHNFKQTQIFGNTYHIIMTVEVLSYILGLEQYQNRFPKPKQRDCMKIGMCLHDAIKLGFNHSQFTLFDHPLLAQKWIEETVVEHDIKKELKKYIGRLVVSHSGQFNTSNRSNIVLPKPETEDQELIHLADYLSSRNNLDMTYSEELENTINDVVENMISSYQMDFGKYNGRTIKSVFNENPDYFDWLEKQKGGMREPMKTIIDKLRNETKEDEIPWSI